MHIFIRKLQHTCSHVMQCDRMWRSCRFAAAPAPRSLMTRNTVSDSKYAMGPFCTMWEAVDV